MALAGLLAVAILAGSAAPAALAAQENSAKEAWSLDGFSAPESAIYDAERQEIYVSNVVGDPLAADGQGFVSRVSPDGEMLEAEWVAGFDAPKGLAVDGATLYVADISRLVAINTATGEIMGEWAGKEGDLLNDVAIDDDGRVFVSGTLGNRIYMLEDDALSVWLEDPVLNHPNGLKVDGNRMLVAPWGKMGEEDPDATGPGQLLTVDLGTREIASFGEGKPSGNLDGIEPDGSGGWLVTEFADGELVRLDAEGVAQDVADTPEGSADLGVISDDGRVLVPVMLGDRLVAYDLN